MRAPIAPPAAEALLSVRQLAQEAANSEAFWRKLIARRQIPVVRLGRLVRVRRRDLEAWLRAHTQPIGRGERDAALPTLQPPEER